MLALLLRDPVILSCRIPLHHNSESRPSPSYRLLALKFDPAGGYWLWWGRTPLAWFRSLTDGFATYAAICRDYAGR
jgi:hypothetical protein